MHTADTQKPTAEELSAYRVRMAKLHAQCGWTRAEGHMAGSLGAKAPSAMHTADTQEYTADAVVCKAGGPSTEHRWWARGCGGNSRMRVGSRDLQAFADDSYANTEDAHGAIAGAQY